MLLTAPLLKGMKPTSNPKTPANLAMFLVRLVLLVPLPRNK